MRLVRWWTIGVVCAAMAMAAMAREPHRPHRRHRPRVPRPADGQPDAPGTPANALFAQTGTITLPGRGLSLAWSPDGARIAVGGRFREAETGLRYDTRIADVASQTLEKSFACHYFFVVATAWTANPFLGEIVADGGGDHAVKLWRAGGGGSATCKPGQFAAADGAVRALPEIDGWTLGLAFSPDGRFLAGASRDRMVRIWSLAPGSNQFRVVGVIFDRDAGNVASVAWQPDGHGLVTADRRGHVTAWDFDPTVDGFDQATIDDFAATSYEAQPAWCQAHAEATTRTPRWRDERTGWVWNVRVAPDGTRAAAVGDDGQLVVYDLAAGGVAFRTAAPSGKALHALDWSPNGTLLATGGADRAVQIVDAATGAPIDRLEGHADVVSAVAWSPDGRMLASTAGGPRVSLALLNVTTGPDLTIRLWTRR
jgi:WD40 repeat protein